MHGATIKIIKWRFNLYEPKVDIHILAYPFCKTSILYEAKLR